MARNARQARNARAHGAKVQSPDRLPPPENLTCRPRKPTWAWTTKQTFKPANARVADGNDQCEHVGCTTDCNTHCNRRTHGICCVTHRAQLAELNRRHRRRGEASARAAYFLPEVVVAISLAVTVLVASLQATTILKLRELKHTNQQRAVHLASNLLSEIAHQSHTPLGQSFLPRQNFDDIDDYHNLSESPPQAPDGTALPGFDAHWQRTTSVTTLDLGNVVGSLNTTAKRLSVTVAFKGTQLAQLQLVIDDSHDLGKALE